MVNSFNRQFVKSLFFYPTLDSDSCQSYHGCPYIHTYIIESLYPKGSIVVDNKKIVIVGGSSGIGFSVAQQLTDLGANVIIASRSRKNLDFAKEELGITLVEQVDASREDSVISLFRRVGEFDHLVVTIKPDHLISTLSESDITDTRAAFDGKFWGQYYLTKHCLPYISKSGSITLTSGIASRRGYEGFSSTAAINGAIESFVTSVAGEISPTRINAVCPGFIETDSEKNKRYESVKKLGASPVIDRLGTKEEVAQSYLYLISNNYSTGSCLVIDGGELSV